jgi:hypothetical protein
MLRLQLAFLLFTLPKVAQMFLQENSTQKD